MHAISVVAQTNHQLNKYVAENKVDTVICFRMGETYLAKTPLGDFKVITSENSLLSQQAVTSKGILVPYTNQQLNPYPNTKLDLFCSDNLSFQCMDSDTWLINLMCRSQYVAYTPNWEECWLQSCSVHQHDENHEASWLQNLTTYKRSSFLKGKMN